MSTLALLGGEPSFPEGLPFVRPPVPPLERVMNRLSPSYERGILTNGPLVSELEERIRDRLQVRNVVAVASCTAGLMLTLRALRLEQPVLLPSFTFSASAHAVAWNGCRPRFAECDPESFQLDPADAALRLDGVDAVLATHVFGAPCSPSAIESLGRDADAPVVFDAAHGFGARSGDRPIGGFGDAEVFSLSPTKPFTAGEGGLVTTDRDDLAADVRIGRDYANPGDYDSRFPGLNARLSELHAALALESLAQLDDNLRTRRTLAQRYVDRLADVPGVRVQRVRSGDESTWKDFTIIVDENDFGVGRDLLVTALRAEGIDTRCYFDPPVHLQHAYRAAGTNRLPVTEHVTARVVSLPLYPSLSPAAVDRVCEVVARVHANDSAVAAADDNYGDVAPSAARTHS
ncbi:MAG: DegT/DnrJ/EryC1/StrS family aminotransferase [Actinomycetota bacterium]